MDSKQKNRVRVFYVTAGEPVKIRVGNVKPSREEISQFIDPAYKSDTRNPTLRNLLDMLKKHGYEIHGNARAWKAFDHKRSEKEEYTSLGRNEFLDELMGTTVIHCGNCVVILELEE